MTTTISSPLYQISHAQTLDFGKHGKFTVVIHAAYNAMGLIGFEHNGIGILDEKHHRVLLAGHCRQSSGYNGPSQGQIKEWERVCNLSWEDFCYFVNNNREKRYDIGVKKTRFSMSKFIELAKTDVSYNSKLKDEFHRQSKIVLRKIAAGLGLKRGDYDLRSNMGGIAVSGEITLHADNLYVQFSQSVMGSTFMFRHCNGRKDYSGSKNNLMPFNELVNISGVIQSLRNTMERG
ncbi:MAG: hypothetical protein Q8P20_09915 [bacterium]|nr:hypothetical protein [bacterium]